MNKVEMMYKADTGNQPKMLIESEHGIKLQGRNIRAIEVSAFLEEQITGNDIIIPTPEYVKWLEEKVENQ